MQGKQSVVKDFQTKFLDCLSDIALSQFYSALQSRDHIYFIVDTEAHDSSVFEGYIVNFINSKIGRPYVLSYEKIGKETSFANTVLPLIFLRSDFSAKIAEKCGDEKITVILRSCIKGSGHLFYIAKKFLECRNCSPTERRKLGLDYDLSDDDNAIDFFEECLRLYEKAYGERPAFIFKELNPNLRIMSLNSTLSFFKRIERLPTVFFLIIPKQSEYCIMPLWDKFPYIKLNKIKHDEVARLIKSTINDEFAFTDRGLQLFCRKMRSLYGNEIPSTPLITALTDLFSFKKANNLNKLDVDVILKFFSVSFVKIRRPVPRPPSKCKSPYFGSEVERLTNECIRLKLDPHTALPFPFRYVLWHIKRGNIEYNKEGDFFISRRYIGLEFKKLTKVLSKLGYKYKTGTGKWVFSPNT
ncbi:MAG: hypothetical protein QXQ94_08995 [Candidatus Bathyarchaeia archaeon]